MMKKEAASSIRPPSSSSAAAASSSSLVPAGRGVVKKHKEEAEPPAVVMSSSSASLPAATSVPVKQEEAEVKDEEVNRERSIDDNARLKNDWERGNWCWLDEYNFHATDTAPGIVKEEAVTEEEKKIKTKQNDEDVVSAPQLVSSFSSSPSINGIGLKKENLSASQLISSSFQRGEKRNKTINYVTMTIPMMRRIMRMTTTTTKFVTARIELQNPR